MKCARRYSVAFDIASENVLIAGWDRRPHASEDIEAMKPRTIRRWSRFHSWTSIACTLFLLGLCVTGLPLIFKDELDQILYDSVEPAAVPLEAPPADLDRVAAAALAQHPDQAVQFLIWDRDDRNVVRVAVGRSISSDPRKNVVIRVDEHTARFLDEPHIIGRATNVLLRFHTELLSGMNGKLFLGAMGILFLTAIVSGVALYGPAMRKLDFGILRRHRSSRLYWFDLHNLLGIITVAWALVVGLTGVVNTGADIIVAQWRRDQLAAMTASVRSAAVQQSPVSVQKAVDTARNAAPGMTPLLVAYPGTAFSSSGHYTIFMHGDTALTSRLLKPALVDAGTGELTEIGNPPWYVAALLVSQPLHFGDYGGLPLKVMWALLDAATITVIVSGLYLWLSRLRRPSSLFR
jgi:uncharacterized iron-regulated membrane protein